MKAIIKGKRYDTSKCELIGETTSGGSHSDFHYWEAGLYRTPRTREYFIAGEGGPLTAYGHATGDGNGRVGGERIVPVSPEDALAWAEANLAPELVERAFGSVIQDA